MSRVEEILSEAEQRLLVARSGFQMLASGLGEGKIGLRNLAVFGRMVTFATNNLRSVIDGFESWDAKAKSKHFDNDHSRYMVTLRNVIEKQARTPVSTSAHFSFNANDLAKFPRPPGATAFFMGDQSGGSGWMIAGSDGKETPYYIDLPPEIGNVWLTLPEFENNPATDIAKKYLDSIAEYFSDVKQFVGSTR